MDSTLRRTREAEAASPGNSPPPNPPSKEWFLISDRYETLKCEHCARLTIHCTPFRTTLTTLTTKSPELLTTSP